MNNREIDKLIAEKLFGYEVFYRHAEEDLIRFHDGGGGIVMEINIPYYSRDINAAWEVAEKLRSLGEFTIGNDSTEWIAEMTTFKNNDIDQYFDVFHESATIAICLVALELVGVEL